MVQPNLERIILRQSNGQHNPPKYVKRCILICVRGATTGRMNWADREYCIGRGIAAIRPNSSVIIPKLLYYFLYTQTRELLRRSLGSTFPNLKSTQLRAAMTPLPPLEEQRRIVTCIEQIVSRAEEAIKLRRIANEEAEKIMQAALKKVFSRAEKEGWEWKKLEKLILIESGKRPKGGSTEYGVPSLGGEQLLPTGDVNWDKLRYVPEDFFDNMKRGKAGRCSSCKRWSDNWKNCITQSNVRNIRIPLPSLEEQWKIMILFARDWSFTKSSMATFYYLLETGASGKTF